MSDPYRLAGHSCPTCRSPLRPFLHRWVCDSCGGMLIGVADFEQSVLDTGKLGVVVEDDTPTELPCPRCATNLRACLVKVGGTLLREDILHCDRHGLWLGAGMLERVFAKLEPKSLGRRTGEARFLIRKWWQKPRPAVLTPFRSALVGRKLPCPACGVALVMRGRTWACDDHGVFVEHAALAEMMMEMTQRPWEPPAVAGAPGERVCPACSGALTIELLEGITVDRCPDHGIWFDPSELETSLANAVGPSRSWFERLFG